MPCLKLPTQLDLSAAFSEAGLHIQLYNYDGDPEQVLTWEQLEDELLHFGNDCARDRVSWAKEMATANQLIRLGLKLRHAMNAIREQCDRDPRPFESSIGEDRRGG